MSLGPRVAPIAALQPSSALHGVKKCFQSTLLSQCTPTRHTSLVHDQTLIQGHRLRDRADNSNKSVWVLDGDVQRFPTRTVNILLPFVPRPGLPHAHTPIPNTYRLGNRGGAAGRSLGDYCVQLKQP